MVYSLEETRKRGIDMKTVAPVVLLLGLAAFFLASCTQPGSTSTTSSAPPAPTSATTEPVPAPRILPPAVNTSTQLKDANGNFLGYVIFSDAGGLEISTPKGYIVSLDWGGALHEGIALFAQTDGTGTMFVQWSREHLLRGYVTVVNGKPYVAASVNADGFAIADPGITSYQSYYFDGTIANLPATPVLEPYDAYPLKQAQLADIGMPSSVSLPMQLVSQ
jgi:hypothetical protein